MDAVVLGWDPDRGPRWVSGVENVRAAIAASGRTTAPWLIRSGGAVPPPGTPVHLMLQGGLRGLVGRGMVRSSPFMAGDPQHPGNLAMHVLVVWDRLLLADDAISVARLTQAAPDVPWDELYTPVLTVSAQTAAALDALWEQPQASESEPGWWPGGRLVGAVQAAVRNLGGLAR